MSLLKTVTISNATEARTSKADPEKLIAGDPTYTTWPIDSSRGGQVDTGIWESTPGTNHSIKGEAFEFCHILEGVVELTEQGHDPVIYRAGDSFVMKPGYVGTWRTIEKVRKIYVFVS